MLDRIGYRPKAGLAHRGTLGFFTDDPTMKEAAITASIMRWLKTQPDVFCWKQVGTSMTMRGLPDIVGTVGGAALFLEVKTETGKVSASQASVHRRIFEAGSAVSVVRSLKGAQLAVSILREKSLSSA